jgi:hypothetical protein
MTLTDEQIAVIRDGCKGSGKEWSVIFTQNFADDLRSLATEVLATRQALRAICDEDRLEEIITDSIDLDWTPRTAARAIVRAMKGGET